MMQQSMRTVSATVVASPVDTFQPLIIALCCNWCSYAGADLAGVSRIQYPPNIRVIRVMCSGMVHPSLVTEALTQGADGVLMCGCHLGDCHYQDGNVRAERRAEAIRVMLADFGLEEERFRLEWVSAAEGPRFAQVVEAFTKQVQRLGPSPYKSPR
jgi:F420-non-reducing hydrogenase iron-sulfur subunit